MKQRTAVSGDGRISMGARRLTIATAAVVVAQILTAIPAHAEYADAHPLLARARSLAAELEIAVDEMQQATPSDSMTRLRERTDDMHPVLDRLNQAVVTATTPEEMGTAALEAVSGSAVAADISNAALNVALELGSATSATPRALKAHAAALALQAGVLAVAETLLDEFRAARAPADDALGARVAALGPSLRDVLHGADTTARAVLRPEATSDEVGAALASLATSSERAWRLAVSLHQTESALVSAAAPAEATNLCDGPAAAACVRGWAEADVDPRVAAITEALQEGDAATADTYYNLYSAFLPPAVRVYLDELRRVEYDLLYTVGTAPDSLELNESAETTAKASGRDRNGRCCARTPYRWELSGVLYFYYCFDRCVYPGAMRFELDTSISGFSSVPYTGYFTHYYGPPIYISRYDVPMREDIVDDPDKTRATYSCGIGSLPLSCYSTRSSPTTSGRYYFNETRLWAHPQGYPDYPVKWQTRRWVPYSSTQAQFPAYHHGG